MMFNKKNLFRLQSLLSPLHSSKSSMGRPIEQIREYNANRSNICKISRTKYCRLYRVLLVYPDGSTVTVRHPEPQAIIQLPVLLEDCKTDIERKEWLSRRKRVEKVETEDDIDLQYNQKQYLNYFKNKSRN